MIAIGDLVERSTRWFLYHRPRPLDISENVSVFGDAVGELARSMQEILPKKDRREFEKRCRQCQKEGIPAELSRRLASVAVMEAASDIALLSRSCEVEVKKVGAIYFALGARFEINRLRRLTMELGAAGVTHWEKAAAAAVLDKIFEQHKALTRCILQSPAQDATKWLKSRQAHTSRVDAVMLELRSASSVNLEMLTVASHQLRLLATS